MREILRTVAQAHSRGVIIRCNLLQVPIVLDIRTSDANISEQGLERSRSCPHAVMCPSAAHHRDVKPDNFLFLNSNEHSGLRAIDFGLAEYCEPGQYLTDRASRFSSSALTILTRDDFCGSH